MTSGVEPFYDSIISTTNVWRKKPQLSVSFHFPYFTHQSHGLSSPRTIKRIPHPPIQHRHVLQKRTRRHGRQAKERYTNYHSTHIAPTHEHTVFNAPLHKHSSESSAPKILPSSLHAGYCTAANPIGAQLTSAFIRASGLKDVSAGQRFCVSAASWKKVADKGEDVPGVTLASSHVGALDVVGLDVLKKWEVRDHRYVNSCLGRGQGFRSEC